ncbi:MAG: hypothetical protein ACRC2J_02410 [Microcoleaceae cyanobacterium]
MKIQQKFWGEKFLAFIVLCNVIAIIFDQSYLLLRDFYLKVDIWRQPWIEAPQEKYVEKINLFRQVVEQEGINSPRAAILLGELQAQTRLLFVEELPFRVLDQHGVLGTIRTRIQARMQVNDTEKAFEKFWQPDYLLGNNFPEAMTFLREEIEYLLLFYEPRLWYDLIKGIEPDRDTQAYLRQVVNFNLQVEQKYLLRANQSIKLDQNIDKSLQALRKSSQELIDNPRYSQIPHNFGRITQVKYTMGDHIYGNNGEVNPYLTPTLRLLNQTPLLKYLAPEILWANRSTKQAFFIFWSRPHLEKYGWQNELDFFENNITFALQSVYFRHRGVDGKYIDRFWLVDLPWLAWFWLEFLTRTWLLSRSQLRLSWWGAVKQRWYDLFLLQPFFPLWRILPAIIRLHQVRSPDMKKLAATLRLTVITSFAKEITDVILIQGINQVQYKLGKGYLQKQVFPDPAQNTVRPNVQINPPGKVQIIGRDLWEAVSCDVLPEIQPQLEAFLTYHVEKSLQNIKIYRGLQRLPLLKILPNKISQNLAIRLTRAIAYGPEKAYQNKLNKAKEISDPVAEKLREQLVTGFRSNLMIALQQEHTITEIETLITDWLEEIKINYLKAEASEDLPVLQPDEITAIARISEENINKKK